MALPVSDNVMTNINGNDLQWRNSQTSHERYFYSQSIWFVLDDGARKRGIGDIVFTTGSGL
jgi:hypothetical protein